MKSQEDLEEELIDYDQVLIDLRQSLAVLTSPDYDPAKNADDEYREHDIEYLWGEIMAIKKCINSNRSRLGLPALEEEPEP